MAQWLERRIAIRPCRWFYSVGDSKLIAVSARQLLRSSVRCSLQDVPPISIDSPGRLPTKFCINFGNRQKSWFLRHRIIETDAPSSHRNSDNFKNVG
ncbi:hypothetical protein Y032_0020g51 [Ancylostoma ceylanicum]|uniref:Uncharacterized protein n=1 Tax=Ancylostoma ceylanicum TaxID=53326 RepID=A0A016V394_9BILA|nr:hypothetical protein Y032_0020g51 [Ancylostoma ceylanicum]